MNAAHAWQSASLESVARVVNGGTPRSDVAEYWDGGVQWLTPKDMGRMQSKEIASTPRTITQAGLQNSSARLVPENSIILSTRAPIGHLAINTQPMAFNQGCRGIVPGSRLNHQFLYYFLLASRSELDDLGTGATFKELSSSALRLFEVPVPPMDEQKRLVAVLDQAFTTLDRARANAEVNLSDVDSLQTAVVKGQFAGRESWPAEPLGARVRFIDYRGRTPAKTESGVPLLTAKNVRMGYVKDEPREFIAREAYTSWMTRGIPKRGDVLFTTEAPLANVAQVETDEPVALAQRLITMQPPAGAINSRFLKWSLMSPQMQADITEKGTGATVTGIKASLLKLIPLHLPDLDRQQQIAEVCESAFLFRAKLRNEIEAKLADLAALRQSLLEAAFSGQLS